MSLLDANLPTKLVGVLQEYGIRTESTESRGWKALTNGQLVEAAIQGGFTAVLTRDRLFGEAAARALKQAPQFAVVLIRLPQLRGPEFLDHFRNARKREPIRPEPGRLVSWPG